jgi:hypothetical protein
MKYLKLDEVYRINRLEGMTDEEWDEENERKIGDV